MNRCDHDAVYLQDHQRARYEGAKCCNIHHQQRRSHTGKYDQKVGFV